MLEIDSVDGCRAWLALGERRPPAAFQAVDLRPFDEFGQGSFEGCLFLSCSLSPMQAAALTGSGALVIRDGPERPFTAHRARLYTVDELYAGFDPNSTEGWAASFDATVYRHVLATGGTTPTSISESLARRMHDHSITDALDEVLQGRRVVAVMGGHAMERAAPLYAAVARIARALTRDGYLMVSGGGPGAMEATHLGAWMSHLDDDQLDAAIHVLSPRPVGAEPGVEYTDADWLHRAFAVRARWPLPQRHADSIGIPTWTYGHEPPAAFATLIAKYFANSVREDGLLTIATNGVVFTPGSAGTIQEIFQDAAQNHYETAGPAAPMVLYGVDYWTTVHPVWQLLESLADGHPYRSLITLTDDEQAVTTHIRSYPRP